MDRILGVIQGYEGKFDATIELTLDMQKRFEEKLEALREENGEIKARLYDKRDDSEKERSPEKSEEERSHHKSQKDKAQSSKGTHQETKEPKKNRESEVSDTMSSYPRSKKVESV